MGSRDPGHYIDVDNGDVMGVLPPSKLPVTDVRCLQHY